MAVTIYKAVNLSDQIIEMINFDFTKRFFADNLYVKRLYRALDFSKPVVDGPLSYDFVFGNRFLSSDLYTSTSFYKFPRTAEDMNVSNFVDKLRLRVAPKR